MSERNVLRNELCIAGQDLKKGDFVKFSDGGRKNYAHKCAEAKADGICTMDMGQGRLIEVDVFEPWSYSAGVDDSAEGVTVMITRHPDKKNVGRYVFNSPDEKTRGLIIDLLIEKWGAK